MQKLSFRFAPDHPTGAGHFPGNPIIPGALLLAEVLRRIEQAEATSFDRCNVKAAKFLNPVRPGDTVDIEYARAPSGTIEFKCFAAGANVLSGAVVAGA